MQRRVIAFKDSTTKMFDSKQSCASYFETTIRTINRHIKSGKSLRGWCFDLELQFDDLSPACLSPTQKNLT